MSLRHLVALAAALPYVAFAHGPDDHRPVPKLVPVGAYSTGLGAEGAEIISVRPHDGLAAMTNVAGSVDLLDLSDPSMPTLVRRIPVDTTKGTPNSVALHPEKDYLLVVTGRSGSEGRILAYGLDGTLLASAPAGIQPDSIVIGPGGRYAVVANEAEGVAVGNDGGAGSLTLVDLDGFSTKHPRLRVRQIALPSAAGLAGFSTGRTDDLARLPVDNSPGTLEPESIAFSPSGEFAYVTLQENSGVVRLELETGKLRYFGLGQTTHAADLSTADGAYLPASTLTSFREPDGIAVDPTGRFFYTADEGDTRNATAGSGPRGGRTVSVFDARTGALLGDTASQLDDWAALAGSYPDARSNRGGSEPEVLDVASYRGRTLVAVGLERANSLALIDVTDPSNPTVIDIEKVGAAPEGVKFFRRGDGLYVATANEVDGTVSVLQVR